MSWLNKLTKGVEEAASRATSEADKAIRLTKVNNEIGSKRAEIERTFTSIGQASFKMYQSGVTLPEPLTEQFQAIEALQQQIQDLEAQRDAIRTAGATPDAASAGEPAATPAFCHACGSSLPPGSAHCPKCGQRVGV